jgi:hypothetical protein
MIQKLLAWLFRDKTPPAEVSVHHQAVLATGGEATHSVVLRLDPGAMENADLQVRWDLEKTLRALYPDIAFYDDGYGFTDSEAMFLVYATRQPDRLVEALVDIVTNDRLAGYAMAAAAMVAVAPREPVAGPGEELADHRVVYPPQKAGSPLPD